MRRYIGQFLRFVQGKPLVHCWAEGPREQVGRDKDGWPVTIGSTCIRTDGHLGRHNFRADNVVQVLFGDAADAPYRVSRPVSESEAGDVHGGMKGGRE